MAEKPRALPRMMIDTDVALAKAVQEARKQPLPGEGAGLGELDEALRGAHRLYSMLRDCEGPEAALDAQARRVFALARRRADHPDADEARPRALALELASRTARERGQVKEGVALAEEAAERWLEAAED